MEKNSIYKTLNLWQNTRNSTYQFELFQKFEKLLSHYESRLDDNDANGTMIFFLLNLFTKIELSKFHPEESEKQLFKYVCLSLKREYYRLCKKQSVHHQREVPLEFEIVKDRSKRDFSFQGIEVKEALRVLSDKQKEIVYMRYYLGLSDAEISKHFQVSRQDICKQRNGALHKMKKYLES